VNGLPDPGRKYLAGTGRFIATAGSSLILKNANAAYVIALEYGEYHG
jgi:hypothetical protein